MQPAKGNAVHHPVRLWGTFRGNGTAILSFIARSWSLTRTSLRRLTSRGGGEGGWRIALAYQGKYLISVYNLMNETARWCSGKIWSPGPFTSINWTLSSMMPESAERVCRSSSSSSGAFGEGLCTLGRWELFLVSPLIVLGYHFTLWISNIWRVGL